MATKMYNPVSTYRIQFNKDFTFQQATTWVAYLAALGIRTVYASPIFAAVPGSTHGYDVINPFVINPEIGTEDQLRQLIRKLKEHNIGWIQDIVPNHMAHHTMNPWMMDIMEKGPLSPYAQAFDTSLSGDFHVGRLMAPFLDGTAEELTERGELKLVLHESRLCLAYGDGYYPINSRSYADVLSAPGLPEGIAALVTQVEDLHSVTDPVQYTLRWHECLLQFAAQIRDTSLAQEMQDVLAEFNADVERLQRLVSNQFYKLCHWRDTDIQINYRRFFLVNGLICLNMQAEKVFHLYHERIAQFVKEGLFQGIRVDHVDGLFDPATYLQRLRALLGSDCFIVVEKILEHHEQLDVRWPVQGTSGYEFLGAVNNLFTRSSAENRFSKFYRSLTQEKLSIAEKILEKKQHILDHHMQGELANLSRYFMQHLLPAGHAAPTHREDHMKQGEVVEQSSNRLAPRMDTVVQFGEIEIRDAIATMMVEMPVYRYYGNHLPLAASEADAISKLLRRCETKRPDLLLLFEFVGKHLVDEQSSPHWTTFYQRIMQYTGPLMAKGVEDTLMYTFNRFVGHNEVGDSPEFFGISTEEFHEFMMKRQQHWPLALNATSTHDTKRGEDVRMRLNVLPDLAEAWIAHVRQWMDLNRMHKTNHAPDDNDEYFIYQNLVGVYPHRGDADLAERLKAFMTKAMREAKRHSDWSEPNEAYEAGVLNFVDAILASDEFMTSFVPFCRRVTDFGMINSLSQLVLKATCPGTPDIYQGTAGWDLSLVDPDNRRPVDYVQQAAQVTDVVDFQKAWNDRDSGLIKSWTLQQILRIRNAHERLFRDGQYIPLEVEGAHSEHCLAFARQLGGVWLVVAIPLNVARFMDSASAFVSQWGDTKIVIPAHAPLRGRHLVSDAKLDHAGSVLLSEMFAGSPIAAMVLEDEPVEVRTSRKAGILLPISALPGAHGVGDLGPSARLFADFLHRSRQRVWQILPINPAHASSSFSPYSSYSGMAGSIVYISPEDLIGDGLLETSWLKTSKPVGHADYAVALDEKKLMLRHAYENYRRGSFYDIETNYKKFMEAESSWLRDFAMFELLKERYQLPWPKWPDELRDRDPETLLAVGEQSAEQLDLIMWSQYLFHRQWMKLKNYCHDRDIRIMGDLPFYLDHNAADVWAHREFFSVNKQGELLAVAGVPPDYFSADGQLWGMPVYNWDAMRRDDYAWFVDRIRRNLDYFDMLRLDHFRAFSSYWEVASGQTTARDGIWKPGPGKALFDALTRAHGRDIELIAEDLGEITDDVYKLRDTLQLPGMHVLQFTFGESTGANIHSPHHHVPNSVVYTGTHDNNTTRGWFRKDLDGASRKRLAKYIGREVSSARIAEAMIRLAYSSVSRTCIIPIQDVLNLNERARLNTPSTIGRTNWSWRMTAIPDEDQESYLCELSRLFGR